MDIITGDFMREEQETIKRLIVKYTKMYRCKGPLYVKVKITNELINIYIKGIVSNIEEILLEEDNIEQIEIIWEIIKHPIFKQFLNELQEVMCKKYKILLEESNFKDDFRILILKRIN
jgi:uncharacterized protein YbcI